ncbi:glycosyltransferase family 2 protein [Candidatus Parcubacteria bacterium]|nr:glycosyltransferase family 2 protein [Candidatus Parcubacteria bacterium]
MMKLSIVVPVYNEEKTLKRLISKIQAVNFVDKEVILINDCSKDKSADILKQYASKKGFIVLSHGKNKGKGGALKTGFEHASGDYVIVQDADLEYNPQDYKILLNELKNGKFKVVYGSRFMGQYKDMSNLHYIGNKVLTLVTNILYGQSLTDMETCYKLIPIEVIKEVDIKSKRFNFEPEITAKILKMGYKIKEVPISYFGRTHSEGKHITWQDGFSALWTLIKFRFTN